MRLEGLVSDRSVRPMRPVPQPRPGESFIDPAFGTRITRITASSYLDGDNAVIKTMYSTMQAWNADESMILLWDRKLGHTLYNGQAPYNRIGTIKLYAPTDIESVMWDPVDPQTIYYPTNYQAYPAFIEHNVVTGAVKVCYDFHQNSGLPYGDWAKLLTLGSDPQWMTRGNGKLVGFKFDASSIIFSIADCVVVARYDRLPTIYKNAFMPTPSEKFVQLDRWVFTPEMQYSHSLSMSNPYEHACPGLLMDGVDTWNQVDFKGPYLGSLVSHRVDTGKPTVVIGPATGFPFPPPITHISSVGPAEWAVVGIVGQSHGQTLLDNELMLANTLTGRFYRIAHLRTKAGNGYWGYMSESHPVISPTGSRILFSSDWLGGPTVDTYVADLR